MSKEPDRTDDEPDPVFGYDRQAYARAMMRMGTIEMQIQGGSTDPAQGAMYCREIGRAYATGEIWSRHRPRVHFVGFKDDRYWSAVSVFGLPDFYHRIWDMRARQEVVPGDVAIFANGDETMPLYHNSRTGELLSWDDSQQDIIARGVKGIDW